MIPAQKPRHILAGTLVPGALFGAFAATAQEGPPEEKAPHIVLIEKIEKDLEEALVKNHQLESENIQLETKVKNLSSANRVLAESMSETKTESEALEENYKRAVLRLELFSAALERDGEGVEDLLVKAASDLRLVEAEKKEMAQALLSLMDAVNEYLGTAGNGEAEARTSVESALANGEDALGLIFRNERLEETTLGEARVITVNKEYNLVLVDVGQRQGLRVGTPISFHRKDRIVGTALVIDVRENFSGAILLDLSDPNDQIVVGDSMRIDPSDI